MAVWIGDREGDDYRMRGSAIVSGSVVGAWWTLVLSGLALPATFVTNIILGRIGPEMFGFYGLISVTVGLIAAFFVFGGGNVVINILPQLKLEDRFRFLLSYTLVCIGFATGFFILTLIFPALLRIMYRNEVQPGLYLYLALLSPIVILQTVLQAALQAEMDIKISVLSQNATKFVTLGSVLVVFMLIGQRLHLIGVAVLGVIVLFSYVVSLMISGFYLYRNHIRNWPKPFSAFIPPGFWKFCWTYHIATILLYIFQSGDQVAVLHYWGVEQLGYYRAGLVTAGLLNWLVTVPTSAIYPGFTNLIAQGNMQLLKRFYAKSTALLSLLNSLGGITIIILGPQLLQLFGASYGLLSYQVLMILVGGTMLVLSLGAANGALLVASGLTTEAAIINFGGALTAIVLYRILVPSLGIVGAAWGYIIAWGVIMIAVVWVLWRQIGIQLPSKGFVFSLLALIGALAVTCLTDKLALIWIVGLWLTVGGGIVAFAILGQLVQLEDITYLWRRISSRENRKEWGSWLTD